MPFILGKFRKNEADILYTFRVIKKIQRGWDILIHPPTVQKGLIESENAYLDFGKQFLPISLKYAYFL